MAFLSNAEPLTASVVGVQSRGLADFDLRLGQLLTLAAQSMRVGLLISDAPSRHILFRNAEAEHLFGNSAEVVAHDHLGRRLSREDWPLERALLGESVVDELIDLEGGGKRWSLNITASPLLDEQGRIIAAVCTARDVTHRKRALESATYLAAAGALLERFDPRTSLQAIVDLAVPALADWCFIHVAEAGQPRIAAIANADPSQAAAARARAATATPLSANTAVARVLSGQPAELVQVTDQVLEDAAQDPEHLLRLKRQGYESAVVAPLVGQHGVLGAVTFAMSGSGRRYADTDRSMLVELARRTGIALDNARLLAAEQEARVQAEAARERTRRLQQLTELLSRVVEQDEVVGIFVSAGQSALGAAAGFAWLLQGDGTLELTAAEHGGKSKVLEAFRSVALSRHLPICDVVRSGRPMMFENLTAMREAYPQALDADDTPFRAWAVLPVAAGGAVVGAVTFSFAEERAFSAEDRDLLAAMIGQGSLALDRCRLLQAERRARAEAEAQALERARLYRALERSEEQLRLALSAGRAGTWSLDLLTMTSWRDPSYCELLRVKESQGKADFMSIHPDDRAEAKFQFERSMREGVPYEPEVRVRRDDGSYLWIRAHGRVIYGSDGKPSMMAGVVVDIDEAKRTRLRVAEEQRINETLHRLGASFASELDHERLIPLIRQEIAKLVGADQSTFFDGWDQDAPTSQRAPVSTAAELRFRALAERQAQSLLAQAELERRVVVAHDLQIHSPHASLEDVELRSLLCVPVVARSGEVFGSLVFGHAEAGRFEEKHERLAASIASQAAVALMNARLYRTVRDQKEQLEVAVERARAADLRKDEFLAMLGHELRNPLAPIVTALALMDLQSDGTLHKEREVIHRQVKHLKSLVDDLLDVSRITRGKIQLSKERLEISAVLARSIEIASPILESAANGSNSTFRARGCSSKRTEPGWLRCFKICSRTPPNTAI